MYQDTSHTNEQVLSAQVAEAVEQGLNSCAQRFYVMIVYNKLVDHKYPLLQLELCLWRPPLVYVCVRMTR